MLITQNSLRTIGWKARKETVHLSLESILIYQQTKVLLTPFGNSLYYGTVLFYLLLVVTLFSFTTLLQALFTQLLASYSNSTLLLFGVTYSTSLNCKTDSVHLPLCIQFELGLRNTDFTDSAISVLIGKKSSFLLD
jgi:hypothetical protein